MRKMLKASSLLICAMLLFSACAGSLNLRPGPFRSEMQDVSFSRRHLRFRPVTPNMGRIMSLSGRTR